MFGPYAYGPVFSRGAEPSLPEKNFSTAPEKNCYANVQNALSDSSHPIISLLEYKKIPDFGHVILLVC